MNKNGPIVIIEDDNDDQVILEQVFKKLGYRNKLDFFSDAQSALEFLRNPAVQPFLIFSDINMPKLDGLELRKIIFDEPDLRHKCIPYIFLTTGSSREAAVHAFELSVQGFFLKPSSVREYEKLIKEIVDYWSDSVTPATV